MTSTDSSVLGQQAMRMALAGIPVVEPASCVLASQREAFDWLVRAAALYRKASLAATKRRLWRPWGLPGVPGSAPPIGPSFTAYVDSYKPIYIDPLLPAETDKNFGAYISRVERTLGNREFGFQVPNIQAVSWDAFRRLLQIVAPLLRKIGLRIARFNCFFGNYTHTPFGPHIDDHHLHAFQYVVVGRRSLRTWDSRQLFRELGENFWLEYYQDPLAHQHELPDTTALAAAPGDLLYWPGHHTHCIDTDGPSIGISIVIETERVEIENLVRRNLARLTASEQGRQGRGRRRAAPTREATERALAVASSRARQPGVAKEILFEHLGIRSGRLVEGVPGRDPVLPLSCDDVLVRRLVPYFAIQFAIFGSSLLIAVHGHGLEWLHARSRPHVMKLLGHLNRARRVRVADVIRRFAVPPGLDEEDVLELLRFVVSAGAFARANDDGRRHPHERDVPGAGQAPPEVGA